MSMELRTKYGQEQNGYDSAAGILTLAVLASISSTNGVFTQEPQKKPTTLTLNMSPARDEGTYLLKGRLTCED
jgi:hypothetical protein